MKSAVILIVAALAAPAFGQPLPPLPLPRPIAGEPPTIAPLPAPARPAEMDEPTETEAGSETEATEPAPERIYQAACPAILSGEIEATLLPPLAEENCGLQSPYSVTAFTLAGRRVGLSEPIIVNCEMAGSLRNWVAGVDAYTQTTSGAAIEEVQIGTSYSCRPRNNVEGADVSEHGFGNAADVTGFRLEDETTIGLPSDWLGDGAAAKTMRFAHDLACGHFTTVLGPDTNALHKDHLHLDLGCHGRTCTARLCE